MYKSQHLEGLYDILQQEKTADTIYIHVGLCLCFLAILKNIHALGDSFYVSIKNFSTTSEKKMLNIK